MNELTRERSRIHASIVLRALADHHVATNMNELTLERSRIHARLVPLLNEVITLEATREERSRIYYHDKRFSDPSACK